MMNTDDFQDPPKLVKHFLKMGYAGENHRKLWISMIFGHAKNDREPLPGPREVVQLATWIKLRNPGDRVSGNLWVPPARGKEPGLHHTDRIALDMDVDRELPHLRGGSLK